MSESPKIQKIYDESYFMFKKLIGEIFIIPLILYILAISFITHVSIFNQPLKSQINTYLARKRKILFLILIFLYICHIISLFNITKLETSANTISSNMTLITLLFYIMSIMAVLLTIYFFEEKNKKQIKFDKKNYLQWFIILNLVYFLLDLVNEIVYGHFTFLTPITFFYCIYFQIFFYRYPDDNYKLFLSKGFKYIELNEFDKELINKKLQSIKINEQKYKPNNKYYIPMTYVNSKTNMLGDENSENKMNDNDILNNNIDSYNNNNNKINNLINELYNPNKNINYLENSYEGVLKIIVTFQSNFSIDYGTYYNYNKTKMNIINNNQNNKKNKLSLLNLHNLVDEDNDQDDHFDIANFYTSIIFSFNVSATSSFYVTNKHLTKSLEEFFKLDILLENEFTEERYNKSLIKKLPRLNVKKCFDELSNNIKAGTKMNKSNNNSDILLKCIQNTKNICEKYLKDITSNPHFIIPEVLFFLEIRDQNVFQLYMNINDQIRNKDNNIISRFSRRSENTNNFILSSKCNYFSSNDDYNMKIILKIIKGNYFNNNITINKKKNIKENNDYLLLIRLTYGECNKIVRKKLEETIFVLNEFNKLLEYNNPYGEKKYINRKNEKDSEIIKLFSKFLQLYSKLIPGAIPNQSFKMNKSNNPINNFKEYPNYSNDEDNSFNNFILTIEDILYLIINYYIDEIPNSNQIIHEYFIDCVDDFWNLEKLKKYLKNESNLLSLFQNAINDRSINDIFVLDKNYIYININYKTIVFYELCFKITTSSNFIQLNKKYEFEELKNYIDLMNVELSLGMVWHDKCFLMKEELMEEIDNIHFTRLNYISKYLNKIFNSNILFNSNNWKKIFYDDKSYHDAIDIKFNELKHNNSKNKMHKKNSKEENSFHLNLNNIENNENSFSNVNSFKINDYYSESFKNENNMIYNDAKSVKSNNNNNNIFFNNSEESNQSSETITSHFSKNTNVKNLFDV